MSVLVVTFYRATMPGVIGRPKPGRSLLRRLGALLDRLVPPRAVMIGGGIAASLGLSWVFLLTGAVMAANLAWVYYRVPEYLA